MSYLLNLIFFNSEKEKITILNNFLSSNPCKKSQKNPLLSTFLLIKYNKLTFSYYYSLFLVTFSTFHLFEVLNSTFNNCKVYFINFLTLENTL
jgi:hypothetical protein